MPDSLTSHQSPTPKSPGANHLITHAEGASHPITQPPNHPATQSSPSSLLPFFDPSGVAIIGASANPAKLSHGVLRNSISHGYQGPVYPVNPGRDAILGLPCYPDISEVPDPLELAVIILPAAACPQVLESCGQRGVKAAIIISGGFREVGAEGAALEEELLRIARQHGMRLIGPNCVGTMDAHTGLNTTFIRTMPCPGPIAFVSQSGAICGGILEWTAGKGVGFSRFATLGNEADVSESDLIEALADDPNTRVIVAYIEAIRDGRRFIDVCRRVTPFKPILVIKAGQTQAGSRAVSSHTGSLAGEMAAYRAAFRQSGVIEVATLEELFGKALALAYSSLRRGERTRMGRMDGSEDGPPLRGNRVAIVTNAGGPASLAADELEVNGLALPALSSATVEQLAWHNHPDAQLGNPVDMLGGAEPAHYELAVQTLLADDAIDAVLPILVPQALIDPKAVAEAIVRAAAGSAKPLVACFMGDDSAREPIRLLHEEQIAAYQFPKPAARALGALWQYAGWKLQAASCKLQEAEDEQGDREAVGRLLDRANAAGRTELGEWQSRPVLAAYGVAQPQAELARSADDALRAAVRIGFPVALKIVSPDILHKSEVGGIVLGLADETAVRRAFDALLARARQRRPAAAIEGALVAQMARPGHELIVGMRRDPQFGPLVMVGLGGIYVELLKDVAFRIAPFDRSEALRMIDETHAGKRLRGLRGRPAADIAAVAGAIQRIAQLALDHPRIQEIDVNPLIAYEQGAVAVDARMVLAPP